MTSHIHDKTINSDMNELNMLHRNIQNKRTHTVSYCKNEQQNPSKVEHFPLSASSQKNITSEVFSVPLPPFEWLAIPLTKPPFLLQIDPSFPSLLQPIKQMIARKPRA